MDNREMFTNEERIVFLERKVKELYDALIEKKVLDKSFHFQTLDDQYNAFVKLLGEFFASRSDCEQNIRREEE